MGVYPILTLCIYLDIKIVAPPVRVYVGRSPQRSHPFPNHPRLRWAILFSLGVLLVLGLGHWRASSALAPVLEPLPQDPFIQVYFNHNQAHVYKEPYRKTRRYGDNLEQVILDTLAQAQSSIDIAVQEINLPAVALALRDRHQAGIAVRVILENTYSRPRNALAPGDASQLDDYQRGKYDDFMAFVDQNQDGILSPAERDRRDALHILQQAQIPWIDDTADGSKGTGLMHHKFMVIDGQTVLTGSANWTLSDVHGDFGAPETRGNANALLVIENPDLAAIFEEEFEILWGDGPEGKEDSRFGAQKGDRPAQSLTVGGSAVQVQFSPTSASEPWSHSVNGLIATTLKQAQTNIHLALFVFSEQALSDTLGQAASRGVEVQALIDPSFIYRDYSEALDMLGVAMPNNQCTYESKNQPWGQPILSVGMPQLPSGDKLHHKFALIDDTTVIIGSHNWSNAANVTNDENLLVIQNPAIAAHFKREFERLYTTAELGMTPKLQAKLNEQYQKCQ